MWTPKILLRETLNCYDESLCLYLFKAKWLFNTLARTRVFELVLCGVKPRFCRNRLFENGLWLVFVGLTYYYYVDNVTVTYVRWMSHIIYTNHFICFMLSEIVSFRIFYFVVIGSPTISSLARKASTFYDGLIDKWLNTIQ